MSDSTAGGPAYGPPAAWTADWATFDRLLRYMMFREIVNWLLGPYGQMLLEWYVAHNLLVNGLLVVAALLALVFPRQRDRVVLAVRDRWRKTPLALPERDRAAVERANAHRRAMYAYAKRGRRRP